MTTKILKGHYASAYHLQAPITTLSIAASGYVAGSATYGVYTGTAATDAYTVVNHGTVMSGGAAVSLSDGGLVINGTPGNAAPLIQGYTQGIDISSAAGTVTNRGVIMATSTLAAATAVTLKAGGDVTNGVAGSATGLIAGSNGVLIKGGSGTVANFGAIEGVGSVPAVSYPASYAILLYDGGSVTNAQAGAVIEGQSGVLIFGAAGTVKNLGAIRTTSTDPFNAVVLDTGGDVTNGSATDTSASIYGYFVGVALTDSGGVTNFGTIAAATSIPEGSTDSRAGIDMDGGGRLTNGSATDTSALIKGATGVDVMGTIDNFGTILGEAARAYHLMYGGVDFYGQLTNGSASDTLALIEGVNAGVVGGGTLANFGTIAAAPGGDYTSTGLSFTRRAPGADPLDKLTNGGSNNSSALIEGGSGLVADAVVAVTNFGTIDGTTVVARTDSSIADAGLEMFEGGSVANEGTAALIEGQYGVLVTSTAGTVSNLGTILGDAPSGTVAGAAYIGVDLTAGGKVTNGSASDQAAEIVGPAGIVIGGGAGTVWNFGYIGTYTGNNGQGDTNALVMTDGGDVINGSAADTRAEIAGPDYGLVISGAAGTITNFGIIVAAETYAVILADGGSLVNGSRDSTAGLIRGVQIGSASVAASGTVTNWATIASYTPHGHTGVYLHAGEVTNGSAKDTAALIAGSTGVEIASGFATVKNFGDIGAYELSGFPNDFFYAGVSLGAGGLVINSGSATSEGGRTARIDGGTAGVHIGGGAGTVVNTGEIESTYGDGVLLEDGGKIVNGATGEAGVVIDGLNGVEVAGAAGSVSNLGTIDGGKSAEDAGVILTAGGSVTNGSVSDTTASIYGFAAGILLAQPATITNFGTISANSAKIGVLMGGSGVLTNGSASDTTALIEEGVVAAPTGNLPGPTVTNFGAIEGGVLLGDAIPGTLMVEAGSTIVGSIAGGGGTLDLASGTGTIASIVGGDIIATGASDPYDDFATLEIGKGAAFTLSGAGTVASGGVTTLDVAGVLDVTGSLAASGTLDGDGTLEFMGSAALFDTGSALTFAGRWIQTGGTIAGTGSLTLTGAGDTLENLTLSAAKVEIDAASATLAGAVDLTSLLTVISPKLTVASVTALTGDGALQLSNIAAVTVVGASAASLLENSDKIDGAGNLGGGQLRLTNEAAGIIDGDAAKALVIDTGAGAFVNAGLVVAVGAGGLAIDGAVDNTGTLEAAGGTLTVDGAVTGAGSVRISGSTADFAAAFSQNVAFTSAGGLLELADSQAYAGTISGFSKTGASSLDLEDISFATATESYSGTAASGVLTVTDGTHTAKINLTGNYLASVWDLTADSSGGTVVTDPTAPSAHGLAAAMAGFAPAPTGGASSATATSALPHPLLAGPSA